MKNINKQDRIFLYVVGIMLISLVILSIFSFIQANQTQNLEKPNDENPSEVVNPTPMPIVTTEKPNNKPNEEDEDAISYTYKKPRIASVSLNPYLNADLTIGGSGVDVCSHIVSLKKNYIFGQTDSRDGDFGVLNGKDMFILVENNGVFEKAKTFGTSSYNDIVLDVKPLAKRNQASECGFLVISKNEEEKNIIYIYKINESNLSIVSTKIKCENEVEVVKSNVVGDEVYILVNEKNMAEFSKVYLIHNDMSFEEIAKIPKSKASDFIFFQNNILVTCDKGNDYDKANVVMIDLNNGNEKSTFSFSDKSRMTKSIMPCPSGYLITYSFKKNGNVKSGVMCIDREMMLVFDHVIDFENYQKILIKYDMGVNGIKGYHIFAVTRNEKSYSTYYENISTRGDLNDNMEAIFKDVAVDYIYKNGKNYIVIGDVRTNNNIDIAVLGVSETIDVLRRRTYGGDNNDKAIKCAINCQGETVVFCNSASSNGDKQKAFGKSDVWLIYPNND